MSGSHGTLRSAAGGEVFLPFLKGIVRGTPQINGDEWVPVFAQKTFTAAEIIAGTQTVIEDAAIPSGMRLYITNFTLIFTGTAFGQDVILSDSNGTPVNIATVAAANTDTGIFTKESTGGTATGMTQGAAITGGTSLTAGKGVVVRSAATNTNGATMRVIVEGYLAA